LRDKVKTLKTSHKDEFERLKTELNKEKKQRENSEKELKEARKIMAKAGLLKDPIKTLEEAITKAAMKTLMKFAANQTADRYVKQLKEKLVLDNAQADNIKKTLKEIISKALPIIEQKFSENSFEAKKIIRELLEKIDTAVKNELYPNQVVEYDNFKKKEKEKNEKQVVKRNLYYLQDELGLKDSQREEMRTLLERHIKKSDKMTISMTTTSGFTLTPAIDYESSELQNEVKTLVDKEQWTKFEQLLEKRKASNNK